MRFARLTLLAALALPLLAAPLAAHAQASGRVPRVGVLGSLRSPLSDVFERALKDLQVRVRDQHEDRQGPRPDDPVGRARASG
jgi:ABC-type sugar transport system substrate-binding protein